MELLIVSMLLTPLGDWDGKYAEIPFAFVMERDVRLYLTTLVSAEASALASFVPILFAKSIRSI